MGIIILFLFQEKLVGNSKKQDSVTNRVAGFICKTVFTEHKQCVSGMAVVIKHAHYKSTYLVSTIFILK